LESYRKARTLREIRWQTIRIMPLNKANWQIINSKPPGLNKREMKRLDAAFESENKALKQLENVLNDDPENPIPRLNMAAAYREIGEIYLSRKNKNEAVNNFRRDLEITQKLSEENALNANDKKQISAPEAKLR